MAYEKSVDISDINRAMFNCPWLEYPGRTKGEVRMDRSGVGNSDPRRKFPGLYSQAGVRSDVKQSYGQSQGGSLGAFKAPYTPQGKFPGPSKAGCLCDSPASAPHLFCCTLTSQGFEVFLLPIVLPLICLATSLLALKTQLVDNLWKPSLLLPHQVRTPSSRSPMPLSILTFISLC